MCPFCYIGKRNFESALAQFSQKHLVQVEWKSYQLDPSFEDQPEKEVNLYQYLSERKGISYEQSVQMHENVVDMAKKVGLVYNFGIAKVTNSFKAHRLVQMAKLKGLGDAMEERLFLAYFTEGKNIALTEVLTGLGKETGLSEEEVSEALHDPIYAEKVQLDIQEGHKSGLTGVPFFVFNHKYGISGAHPPENFLKALEISFSEWQMENKQSI